jgi:lipoprotein-releasing system ATP-binding protein
MIELKNIEKSYKETKVLKGLNLSLKKGEVLSVMGASGAGKSTMLHILGTLDKPDNGEVIFNGVHVKNMNSKQLSNFRNNHIGFVFQFHHLLPEFTALENVCFPAWIKGISTEEASKKAESILTRLGLGDKVNNKPSSLSGGEQQRVAVARALINQPEIILADEPSGNLDSKNAQELHQLFMELSREFDQSFVIVTHNKELAKISDRQLWMKDGVFVDYKE